MTNYSLAALLSKIKWDENEKACIETGLSEKKKFENQLEFFDYCKKWKLAPWVFKQLINNDLNNYLMDEVLNMFQIEFDKIKEQNDRRNSTAIQFLREFQKEGIDVIILKGNYLAHVTYRETGYKRMNDFDILIHKKDWDKIQDVYLRLGYIPLGFGWSGEKEKPASFSHVGMSFISADFSCIIGSQWGLKSPTTSFTVDIAQAWSTAIDFDFLGEKVKALSPEFNLLHLILHMGIFKCGIRDCMDVYNLAQTVDFNEDKLLDLLGKSKAIEKANFTLRLCNLAVPAFSDEFLNRLQARESGFLARRLARRMLTMKETGDFQTSYNDYFQDVEKVVIYFNLFPQFHLKFIFYLKILRMIYFPENKMALRLNDLAQRPTFWHRLVSQLKAPYFVFSLIAQEIGWKFTCLLFVKLLVDLLVSVKNYFVKSPSYFDYLKEKGIDPKEIEKAVKNIQ